MKNINLSEWAIRHRVLVFFFMILALGAGAMSYMNLGREEDPSFAIGTMVVAAYWPGATLLDTMNNLTNTLEEKLEETPDLDIIKSFTTPGRSVIYVQLLNSTNPDDIAEDWYQVRKKVSDIKQNLPEGTQGPFFNDEFGDVFGIVYGVTFDGFSLAPGARFRRDGAGEVPRHPGCRQGRDLRRPAGEGLPDLLARAARRAEPQSQPDHVGDRRPERGDAGRRDHHAERGHPPRRDRRDQGRGRARGDQPLHQQPLLQSDPGREDHPRHRRSADQDVRRQRQEGGRHRRLDARRRQQPDLRRRARRRRRSSSSSSSRSASISSRCPTSRTWCAPRSAASPRRSTKSVAIVLLVSFVSLGFRAGLVVALSIPLVLAITFVFLEALDISLQRISLGALVISLGLLVDDAMITVESMVGQIESGEPKRPRPPPTPISRPPSRCSPARW